MLQKFSHSLFQLSQISLQIYSLKQSLVESLPHLLQSQQYIPMNPFIDIQQLQSIVNSNVKRNININTEYLKRVLFFNQNFLNESQYIRQQYSIYQYLDIPKHLQKNIMNVLNTRLFAELIAFEHSLTLKLRSFKQQFRENSEILFKSIVIQRNKTINCFSLSNFVRTYGQCSISSRSSKFLIQLIKEAKGDEVNREEWISYFDSKDSMENLERENTQVKAGTIKSNRVKLLQRKLNQYRSYQNCQKSSSRIINQKQITDNSCLNYSLNPVLLKRSGSIRKVVNNVNNFQQCQTKINNQPQSSNRLHDSYRIPLPNYSQKQSDNFTHQQSHLSIDKSSLDKTQKIKRQTARVRTQNQPSLKHPYQLYLDNKKVSKDKQIIIQNLQSLNQLIKSRQQLVLRISSYPQFNLFNAFNVLDTYDIGGINYGEFCRQLDNLNIVVDEEIKRNFWNQVTRGSREGLCYEDFIRMFETESKSHWDELEGRKPMRKKFEGIKSWKRELQFEFKQFLRGIVVNLGRFRIIKLRVREDVFRDEKIFEFIVGSKRTKIGEWNEKLGGRYDVIFGKIAGGQEEITNTKFNQYFAK